MVVRFTPTTQEKKPTTSNVRFTPVVKTGPTKFDVPEVVETREQKVARFQAEADQSKREADKYKGVGFVKQFGKELVKNIAPSEVGLGETIAKTMTDPSVYADEVSKLTDEQLKLQRIIKEREAKGVDTTSLKRAYNSNIDLITQFQSEIDKYSKELPTTKQAVGQLAGTALDLLSVGTYGKATAGMKTGRLAGSSTVLPSVIPKGQKGAIPFIKDVAPGAAVGYGYDVSTDLMADKPTSEVLTPGIGTALGAGIPIAGRFGSKALGRAALTAEEKAANQITKTISKREDDLLAIESSYQKIRNAEKYNPQFSESRKRVAGSDVLVDSVDENGVIRTKQPGGAIEQYRAETTDKAESVVYDLLQKEGATIQADSLAETLKKSIRSSSLPEKEMQAALKEADSIVGAYTTQFPDGNIPLSYLQEQKIKESKLINYQTPPEKSALNKALTRGINDSIKTTSKYNIDAVNKELQKYYKDIEYLELLDGKRVKNGRLGKHFAKVAGYVTGSVAGGAVGGPVGSIVGTVAGGEVAEKISSAMLKNTFGSKTGSKIPTSQIVEDAVREASSPRLQLPPAREGAPNVQINEPILLPSETQSTIDARELNNPNIKSPINKINKEAGTANIAGLIAGAGLSTGLASTLPPKEAVKTPIVEAEVKEPLPKIIKVDGVPSKVAIKDKDIQELKPVLFGEVSNRGSDKKELEMRVIVSTALNRMKEYAKKGTPKTLAEVLSMPNQYQAYDGEQYKLYKQGGNDLDSKKREEVESITDKILKEIEDGTFEDITNGAFYYIHNDDGTITYDDEKPLFSKKKKN